MSGIAYAYKIFKSVTDYNHTVHNICTRLKFCEKEPTDAEKIQKTLSAMHPLDKVLCNQYRKENHQVYSQLIHSLIVILKSVIKVDREKLICCGLYYSLHVINTS